MSLDTRIKEVCQSIECGGSKRIYTLIHSDYRRGVFIYQCDKCPQIINKKIPQVQMELYNLRRAENIKR